MQWFRDLSIRHKTTLLITGTCIVSLTLLSLVLIAYEILTFRARSEDDLSALASVVARNCSSALAFRDAEAARQTLEPLRSTPGIVRAAIVAADGTVFVAYPERAEKNLRPVSGSLLPATLTTSRDIILDGEVLGRVTLVQNLETEYSRIAWYAGITGIVLLALIIFAYLLSSQLQKLISTPILQLVERMREVSRLKNYSLRASKRGDDEIGILIDEFNDMLSEIEVRDEQLRQRGEHLHQLAHFDPLTLLPNRLLFTERLHHALLLAERRHEQVAVMFIDLDHFKDINDTLGHRIGDELLREVAQRLREVVRESDTLGRFGGDEFLLLLHDVASQEAAATAAGKIIGELARPVLLDGNEVYVTASIGITAFPADGGTVDELIRNADAAMYQAKLSGKNSYAFYTPKMQERTTERLTMQTSIRRGLEKEEFLLVYQPKYSVADRSVTGVEALLRWQCPELGLLTPDRFIGTAEETGLIVPVTEWVVATACRDLRRWREAQVPVGHVAINVSAWQFSRQNLPGIVGRILAHTGVDPGSLEIEITESMLIEDPDAAVRTLHELKELGVTLALDDFGTGYSSLSYLRMLPIDTVKIDRGFVANAAYNGKDRAIIHAIVGIAETLGLTVVAEGVETEEQLAYLQAQGCHEVQGYLLSRPVPAEEIVRLAGK